MKPVFRLTTILMIALLSACGSRVAQPPPKVTDKASSGRALALIIVEDTGHPFKLSTKSFSKTFKEDAELFAKGAGLAGKVTGCVAGVVAFGFIVAGGGVGDGGAGDGSAAPIAAFCYLGVGVGYFIGYGIGAVVGTVHGTVKFLADDFTDDVAGALSAAFERSDDGAELEAALKQSVHRRPDISLTRLESTEPARDYRDLARQGYPYVIVLRIKNSFVGARSKTSAKSRVYVSVRGEVVETATNRHKLAEYWTYTGEDFDAAKLAENESALLKLHMKKAWAKISSDIKGSIFPKLTEPQSLRSTKGL